MCIVHCAMELSQWIYCHFWLKTFVNQNVWYNHRGTTKIQFIIMMTKASMVGQDLWAHVFVLGQVISIISVPYMTIVG